MREMQLLSIMRRQPEYEGYSRLLSRSECRGLLDLCLPKAMRRVPHFLLALALNQSDLRRFDKLLHKLMKRGLDGRLRASYFVRTAYTEVTRNSLDKLLSNELLPDVIYELTIRLEDNRRSIEVLFSRKGVVSRVMGGAFDEGWEAETQKAMSALLAEKKAKFLRPLFAPVIILLCGAFYLMYTMAFASNGLSMWTLLFYLSYITTSFSSGLLFFLHQQGIYFPHAKIALREPASSDDSGNKMSIISLLSLIVQVIRFVTDYFFPHASLFRKMRWRLPVCAVAINPYPGFFTLPFLVARKLNDG